MVHYKFFIESFILQWIEIRYEQRDWESQTNFQKYFQQLQCTVLYSIYCITISYNGGKTQYTYNQLGDPIQVTDANGPVTKMTYTSMAQHRDPNGQATAFKYDPLGRIIETVAPTGSKQSFSYDALGNRLSEISGEGHTTTYSYDSMNRVSSKKRSTGGEDQYAYDATGSLAKETDANGHSTNYVNDQLEKVTKSDGKTISCISFRNISTLF